MKKIVSVMLVLLMIFSSVTAIFADVVGTSYEEAVKALMASKVVSGYTDGTFRPENTLTRAEACAFLVNYLAPTEEERNAAADSGFTDVTGWATTFVNYAVEKGLVKGYTDGTFRPSNKVNYQELAAMTVNALGIDPEELTGGWPDAYINKAKELGMYENISVSKKNQEEANRGDAAEMIYSLIKYKDTSVKDAVAARLVKSNEALQNVKSMSYEMVMDMGMSMVGESIDMKSVMKLDMILEPMSMYMLADIQSLGEQQNVEYYYVTEGEDLVMYMQVEGQWYKMNMGYALTAAMPENPMENMDLYLKAYNGLRMEGTDLVDGKKSTKIHCELGDEYIEEMMKEVGLAD
ncbi:MAG: S-layer homology domain-containing protein, partial [Firmicutes bacterium]|nr:S-layer homology domain-containing protein [Bacillota bacterium]